MSAPPPTPPVPTPPSDAAPAPPRAADRDAPAGHSSDADAPPRRAADGDAPLSFAGAIACALLGALAIAQAQPPFTTGRALAADFDAHFRVALPLVAAEWTYDFAFAALALGAVALAAAARRASAARGRAAVLGAASGLLAGLDLAARAEVAGALGAAGALACAAVGALAVGALARAPAISAPATRPSDAARDGTSDEPSDEPMRRRRATKRATERATTARAMPRGAPRGAWLGDFPTSAFALAAAALALAHADAAARPPGSLAGVALAHAGALAFGLAVALVVAWGAAGVARRAGPRGAAAGALGVLALLAAASVAEWRWIARVPRMPREPAARAPAVPGAPDARTQDAGNAPGPARSATSRLARPDVVLIVLDTFRADALDLAPDGATPALAAFAREARVARRAFSTSSWTLPAHASLFTGSYPSTHGAHFRTRAAAARAGDEREANVLDDANTTLAELLRDAGYATIGVVANTAYLHSDTNVHQGFEVWDDRSAWPWDWPSPLSARVAALAPPLDRALRALTGLDEAERQHRHKRYRLARDVNAAVVRELDARAGDARPLFLFANYMDAHAPYVPQAATRAALGDALDARWLDATDGFGGVDPDGPGGLALMRGERELRDDERRHLEAAYRGEVRDLDAALGALFDALRARGVFDDAWVVVTADHGEMLGEHRLLGHSSELWDEVVRVPLLVRAPRGAQRAPIEGDVQLVDVLPTLANELGLPIPAQVEGLSFAGDAVRATARPIVAEHFEYPAFVAHFGPRFAGDRRAYRTRGAALFAWTRRAPELWARDGAGATTLRLDDDALRDRLEAGLARWVAARRPVAGEAPPAPLGDEERRRLEALGYL
ncbi:MAG: sulfatase [Myxococcota bacterium]